MTYKGKYKPRNLSKYQGDATNIVYRSSWELKFMKYCDSNPSILEWGSEEFFIPYLSPVDNRVHRYFPDFFVKVKDKNGKKVKYIIEVKPKHQCSPPKPQKRKTKQWINAVETYSVNQAKWKYATEFCKDRGIKFKILTEDHLKPQYK